MIGELLEVLWREHLASTPQAERIHQLLTQRGEILSHDHLALPTFGAPDIGPGIGPGRSERRRL